MPAPPAALACGGADARHDGSRLSALRGYEYVGRQCPMCGMPGSWQRFTWRRLLNGFLDIWGMGNRPMFRSMGHLLWRPGYMMIRDYLGGHCLSYFPPFKMLAVLTMLVALIIWLLGIDTDTTVAVATIGDGEIMFTAVVILFAAVAAERLVN